MPRMTLGGLEDFLRDVEVRVDLLDVVQILERFDEPDDLLRLLALEPHGVRRAHRELGVADGLVDRPLDVRERYVDRPGPVHREAEPEVAIGIAAALARREHHLAGHLGEDRATFDVVRALLALDLGPLGMAGHRSEYYGQSHSSGECARWLQSHQTGSGTSRSPVTAVPARPRSLRPRSISSAR